MNLREYFEMTSGLGVLATADVTGLVDAAIYAHPHFIDEETVAFIMAERLSHHNLEANPNAVYLFKEDGEHYRGKRLYLKKVKDVKDPALVKALRRTQQAEKPRLDPDENKHVVYFRIERERPLVGDLHSGAARTAET